MRRYRVLVPPVLACLVRSALPAALVLALAGCGPTPAVPPAGGGDRAAAGWETLPPGPLGGRVGSTVVGLDDHRALVVGGWEWLCPPTADCSYPDKPLLADGAVVDLDTGEWRAIADAPFGLVHSSAAVLGGQAYLLTSCRSGPGCAGASEVLRYDPGADRWEEVGPVPGHGGSLVPWGDRLLVLAGSDERGERPDRVLDPADGTWTDLPDDPLPRVFDRFAVVDGPRLLVLGSAIRPADGSGDTDRKLAAAYDSGSGTWTRLPDAPSAGYQAWGVAGRVWLNGHVGDDGGAVFDPAAGTWGPLPAGRPGGSSDLAGVVGDGEAAYDSDHGWVVDAVRGRWIEVVDPTPTTYDEAVAAVGSALVVAGGQDWGERPGSRAGRLSADVRVWRPGTA